MAVSNYPVNLVHHLRRHAAAYRDLRNTHAFLRSHQARRRATHADGSVTQNPEQSYSIILWLGCVNQQYL